MNNNIDALYPVIKNSDGTTSTANFVTDYLSHYVFYDDYVKFQYGSRVYDNEDMTSVNIYNPWIEECNSIVAMHIDSWARLYYALSLQYNPLWNVDGTELEKHSEVLTTNVFGKDTNTINYGTDETSTDYASRTNEGKQYEVTYEDAAEHQIGRAEQINGGGVDTTTREEHTDVNTRDAHTDTSTVAQHTIEHVRGGNIGVTQTVQLLTSEWEFRQRGFFKMVAETIVNESGADYDW